MNENEQNLADYLTYVRGVPRREAELRARKATQRLESTSPEDREALERALGEHILREHRLPEAVANSEYEQGVDFLMRAHGMSREEAEAEASETMQMIERMSPEDLAKIDAMTSGPSAVQYRRTGVDAGVMILYGLVAAGAAVGAYYWWGGIAAYILLGVALVVGYWSVALWWKT